MGTIITIARRFVIQQLRTPATLALLIIVPLAIGAVLGFADQRANTGLPVGLVHVGRGAPGEQLAHAFTGADAIRVKRYDSTEAVERAVRRGDVVAGVVITSAYDKKPAAGKPPPPVRIIGDPSKSTFLAARADALLLIERERLHSNAPNAKPAVEHITAASGSHAFGFGRFTAGMLVFFIFDSAMFGAAVLRDDRRRGVIARMTTTPNPTLLIAAGEISGRAVLCVIQAVVIVVAGALLFGMHWGNALGVMAVITLFALAATGAGLLVGASGRGRTVAETEMMTAGLIAVLGLLGGCFWPLAIIPSWLRILSHVSPHAWANDAFDQLLATDAGVAQLWRPLLVLAAFATILFVLGARRMRRVSSA